MSRRRRRKKKFILQGIPGNMALPSSVKKGREGNGYIRGSDTWIGSMFWEFHFCTTLTDYQDKVKLNAAWHKEAQVVGGHSKWFIYTMFAKQCQQAKHFLTLWCSLSVSLSACVDMPIVMSEKWRRQWCISASSGSLPTPLYQFNIRYHCQSM